MNKENKKAEKKVLMNFLIDKEDRSELKKICAINDMTMSAFLRDVITKKLVKEEKDQENITETEETVEEETAEKIVNIEEIVKQKDVTEEKKQIEKEVEKIAEEEEEEEEEEEVEKAVLTI